MKYLINGIRNLQEHLTTSLLMQSCLVVIFTELVFFNVSYSPTGLKNIECCCYPSCYPNLLYELKSHLIRYWWRFRELILFDGLPFSPCNFMVRFSTKTTLFPFLNIFTNWKCILYMYSVFCTFPITQMWFNNDPMII